MAYLALVDLEKLCLRCTVYSMGRITRVLDGRAEWLQNDPGMITRVSRAPEVAEVPGVGTGEHRPELAPVPKENLEALLKDTQAMSVPVV